MGGKGNQGAGEVVCPVAYQCRFCKGPPLPQQWEGACPNCRGFYRSLRVYVRDGEIDGAERQLVEDGEPISAGDLINYSRETKRVISTGFAGVDWLFNGGLPAFGAILLAATSGCGKSTFLVETFRNLAHQGIDSLFITAEQALKEWGQQFTWLGKFPTKHMVIHAAKDKDDIFHVIEKSEAKIVALDSVHTVEGITDDEGNPLATAHVAAVSQLGRDVKRLAGERGILIFAVGHINNDGTIAGGANVRHMLDASLLMKRPKNLSDPRRWLEFEGKTRFGPLGRRVLLEMGEHGLIDKGPVEDVTENLEMH